jgi:type VI secretion system protein ImpH
MGTEGRREDPPLGLAALWEEPFRFEFIQAVRLLHGLTRGRGPVGHDVPPDSEVVRFAVHRDLGFPASQIHDLRRSSRGSGMPDVMTVAFIGLTGPSGVLPTHYSELVVEEARPDEEAGPLAAFLDMFHHRLISFFYRAWERNHPHLSPSPDVRAKFYRYLLAILGQALESQSRSFGGESLRVLRHAELWAQQRRTAEGLKILLEDRLNDPDERLETAKERIDVEIVPFTPRWIELDQERVLRLERNRAAGTLGLGTTLGSRARDWQGRFTVKIGPLTLHQFRGLEPTPRSQKPQPGRSAYRELVELVRRYVGPEFDFEVILVLKANEVPRPRFSRDIHGARLGRGWLATRPLAQNVEARFRAAD